ncbi:TNF receptor-associated factor 3 [Lamellibrachia satsuma]|nr:TNF receptor-associated factor 3 [Lamellibrachia satsuma]
MDAEVMCPALDEDCVMISKDRMFYDRGTCREILLQPVHCIYKVAGCKVTMKWSQLQSHVEKCEFMPVDCSFKEFGCNEKVPRKSLDEHIKHCDYVPVPCSHCHAEVARILRKEHCEKICPNVIVDCPYKCGKKTLRNQMELHTKDCLLQPQKGQYCFIGCTFEGSESEVTKHEREANQEHFDILVKHVEEVDLKCIQLETQLEEQMNEIQVAKENLHETDQQVKKHEDRLKKLSESIQQLRAERDTLATKIELEEHRRSVQEMMDTKDGQVGLIEQRVSQLEQEDSYSRGGRMSAGSLRDLEATTQQVGVHDICLAEMDVRFQCLETANYDGVLIWKVTEYTRRRQDAFQNRIVSLYSQPFYTDRYGNKMCGRVYLNGDGMGKGTHLSLFFVLMRGEYDALLEWPFRQKVTLSLLDQSPARRDLSDTFRPDPTSSSFRRPTTEMNIASGCPMFISHSDLQNSRFLKDDTIYMKIVVDTAGLVPR